MSAPDSADPAQARPRPGEVAVVTGHPVNLADLPEAARQAYAQAAREGTLPPQYAGSVRAVCQLCRTTIWLGPRSAAVRAADPRTQVACLPCVAQQMSAGDVPVRTASLGNTDSTPRELPAWLRAYPTTSTHGGPAAGGR